MYLIWSETTVGAHFFFFLFENNSLEYTITIVVG